MRVEGRIVRHADAVAMQGPSLGPDLTSAFLYVL